MKKGIWLSLLAVVLIVVVGFAIWYINEEGKMRAGSKDAFIPYNSAVVVNINAGAVLPANISESFGSDIRSFRQRLLSRVADTLSRRGFVSPAPYVLALRVEGKSDVAWLYVMDNRDVLSRGEIASFLNQTFQAGTESVRKYDRYKIYALRQGKEEVYFSVCGGIVLIADSELYIEDGIKQFDQQENGEPGNQPRYRNLGKYFSPGAGINVFLNTSAFADLLPLYVQAKKIFPHLDFTQWFKWGALDGEFEENGFCLNGFMQYAGMENSYFRTLEGQQPRVPNIDAVIPAHLLSFGMLNLSDTKAYFSALEAYRYTTGQKDKIFRRKQQLAKMFGNGREEELRDLLQGEFAMVNMAFNEARGEKDGLVIAHLKSGSLCKAWLEKVLKSYARYDGKEATDYRCTYSIDRDKTFEYYRFPVEDLAAVYWGYVFEEMKNRYVLVEDNYLVFASSENAVKNFLKDYVHGNFIRDTEWYTHLRGRLSGKYNVAYFAETRENLPFYRYAALDAWKEYLTAYSRNLEVFPAVAMQWSNEGNMLYYTLFLSTEKFQSDVRPHLLWQTKLDARVSMKPVPVTNHVTGERELLVQDDRHTLYLINDAGRILWKQPIDGAINSEVYQVDMYKNRKLQYLFSTPSKLYLIDRNGNPAGRYPVAFRAECTQGITVFDYDNNRNYRIFAPCADRKVYLYDLAGTLVKGWDSRRADKPIVSRVQHYRVGDKDYIVFADRYRLYILDRKGKERVQVSAVFDLKDPTDIYQVRKNGLPMLAFANAEGPVNLVDFSGNVQTVKCGKLSSAAAINAADINGNGAEDYIIADGDRFAVYSSAGNPLYEKQLEGHQLDFPYVYRFSSKDIRVGILDKAEQRMLLLLPDGTLSKGFPISGDSPFSIVFSGTDGFFLFAGTDNGTIIKYRVQR